MVFELMSGVRNTKPLSRKELQEQRRKETSFSQMGTFGRLWSYIHAKGLFRNIRLRMFKFSFEWDLAIHLFICILSLMPFAFTGDRNYVLIPIAIWVYFNLLFMTGTKHWGLILNYIPGMYKFNRSFKAAVEEFFSPRLIPVLSISFLLVPLSLAVTGRTLGGPPLCFQPCGKCLSLWDAAIPVPDNILAKYLTEDALEAIGKVIEPAASTATDIEPAPGLDMGFMDIKTVYPRYGCGYVNGAELLGYYTLAQTSFLLFLCVTIAMTMCMAWQVADEELQDREAAVSWFKRDHSLAYYLRAAIITKYGNPIDANTNGSGGTLIKPEANMLWVTYGIVSAITFVLLGWDKWYILAPAPTTTLLIILNTFSVCLSTLILHLGFFGRLLTLYTRNLNRVRYLSHLLSTVGSAKSSINANEDNSWLESEMKDMGDSSRSIHAHAATSNTQQSINIDNIDAWFSCRNFVLSNDISIEYDMGGLAMGATFLLDALVFCILCYMVHLEGFSAILSAPGCYCAYSNFYLTTCLLKIFTIATATFEEQQMHVDILQEFSKILMFTRMKIGGLGLDSSNLSRHPSYEYIQQSKGTALNNADINTQLSYDPEDMGLRLDSDDDVVHSSDDEDENSQLLRDCQSNSIHANNRKYLNKLRSPSPQPNYRSSKSDTMAKTSSNPSRKKDPNRDPYNNSIYFNPNGENENDEIGLSLSPLPTPAHTRQSSEALPQSSQTNLPFPYSNIELERKLQSELNGTLDFEKPGKTSNAETIHKDAEIINNACGIGMFDDDVNVLMGSNCNGNPSIPGVIPLYSDSNEVVFPTFATSSNDNPNITPSNVTKHHNVKSNIAKSTSSENMSNSNIRVNIPVLNRGNSFNSGPNTYNYTESSKTTLVEIVTQIKRYDPYPCILGIPVMPRIFNTSKTIVFILFVVVGARAISEIIQQMYM